MSESNNKKALAFAILEFLQKSCQDGTVSADDKESIEVAMQCISPAFGVDLDDPANIEAYSTKPTNLQSIFDVYLKTKSKKAQSSAPAATTSNTVEENPTKDENKVSEADQKRAEELKMAGNKQVSERNFPEAIKYYTQAIEIDGSHAIYYGNRAAAYSQQGDHLKALEDSQKAAELDPKYSKAYSRKGHALFCLTRYDEAAEAYEKAIELDPTNTKLKEQLNTAKAKVNSVSTDRSTEADAGAGANLGGGMGGMPDLGSMLNNPAMMGMFNQMRQSGALDNLMNNPNIMQMAQQMMGSGGGLSDLMNNPQAMDMARQFMSGSGDNNPDGNAGGNDGH